MRQIRSSCTHEKIAFFAQGFFSPTLESKYLAKIMSIQLMAIDRFNITHITCKTISVYDRPRQNDFYKLNSLSFFLIIISKGMCRSLEKL